MRSCLLPAVVLSMLLVAMSSQAQGSGSTALRLCGREFVRAVVHMCGGSRWKREPTGTAIEDYSDPTALESVETNPETQRLRRDLTQLLSNTCCQVGCCKSDIIKLC